MKRLVVLAPALALLAACGSGSHPKASPAATESVAAMRAEMHTLTEAQFQQVLTLGRKQCAADSAGFATYAATIRQQNGDILVDGQMVHYLCPQRMNELALSPTEAAQLKALGAD